MRSDMTPTARAVADIVAKVADGGRLMRGRRYHQQGAVNAVSVEAGKVSGAVGGSGGQVYRSSIICDPAQPYVRAALASAIDDQSNSGVAEVDAIGLALDSLASSGMKGLADEAGLGFRCSCLDSGDPCKHVVALLLAFADAVNDDALDLLKFRSVSLGDAQGGPGQTRDDQDFDDDRSDNFADQADAQVLDDFFRGVMPVGEIGIPAMNSVSEPFRSGGLAIDGFDAAPTFADALKAIAKALDR